MSRRGRPVLGIELMNSLRASDEAKEKLSVILELIAGNRSVTATCRDLGIGATRLRELRLRVLQAALDSLEPRPRGRPGTSLDERDQMIRELEVQIDGLLVEVEMARVRAEIALGMPHLEKPVPGKKTKGEVRLRKRSR